MVDSCARMFQALADETRLKILELLKAADELCVSDIARHFDMTQPSISHHLDVLKRAGLVTSDKRGREVYYRFDSEAIIDCCGQQLKLFDLEVRLVQGGRGVQILQRERRAKSVGQEENAR